MSRTRESTNIQSPVQTHLFFNGNLGQFGRTVEGQDGMENLQLPIKFVVLDDKAFRVSGETRGASKRKIKSNLCHQDFVKTLTVTYSDNGEVIADGTWGQIGEKVKAVGGKYTMILYVMLSLNGEQVLAAIHLRGRAVAEWIKFAKGKNVVGDVFFSVQKVEKTQGNDIDSFVPVFAEHKLPGEMKGKADDMDTVLQSWINQYFWSDIPAATNSRSAGQRQEEADDDSFPLMEPEFVGSTPNFDDLPF